MGEHERFVPPRDRYIDAVFGAGGYLSTAFEGYTPRTGQVALARAVDHAIAERTHLLAEGPTGTGKSLAYAVPASYYAWETGRSVVICTANIALQEQIVSKDLPLLKSLVPWDFTYALLKGRNNYLCEDKRAAFEAEEAAFKRREGSYEERRQLAVVREWAHETHLNGPYEESGDVSELPFDPLPSVWREFSVSADECKKNHCPHKDRCFANVAVERAKQSRVIVTNYHMLFAHLSVFLATGIDLVLPPFEFLICDEAHKAADIARDFFGFKVSLEAVKRFGRRAGRIDPQLYEAVDNAATLLFHSLQSLKHDPKRYKARLTGDFSQGEFDAWTQLDTALQDARNALERRKVGLKVELDEVAQRENGFEPSEEMIEATEAHGEAVSDVDRGAKIHDDLRRAMHPTDHLRHVFFLDEDEKMRLSVASKLVHVGDALEKGLFEKNSAWLAPDRTLQHGNRITVVATSATLATNGTSFDYIAAELGLPRGSYHELVAPSPFDWPKQCLFIAPADMPEPNAPEFKEAVARAIEKTILYAGGRTLCLFTSRRVLEHTYDAIVGTCTKQGIALLKQGQEPRTKLIQRFKEDTTSVLLGLESFWAGVDVPGESCSVVVIDRLPFPTPDDPVLDVLSAAERDWFFKYSVPRAMIAFKQGVGRLVRSHECHGVVVCLDKRLATKRYGKEFLRSLPPGVPKTTRLDAIVEWLNPPPPEAWDAP
jgi:ATP-dependent DNA helicase DinG